MDIKNVLCGPSPDPSRLRELLATALARSLALGVDRSPEQSVCTVMEREEKR